MKTIEDFMVDKIFELANLILAKFVKPDIKIDKVTEIDEER